MIYVQKRNHHIFSGFFQQRNKCLVPSLSSSCARQTGKRDNDVVTKMAGTNTMLDNNKLVLVLRLGLKHLSYITIYHHPLLHSNTRQVKNYQGQLKPTVL